MSHDLYTLRPLQNFDIEEVYSCYKEVGWEGSQSEWIGHILYAKNSSFVLIHKEKVVGVALALLFQSKARLAGVFISPNHRNQGLGKKISEHLISYVREQGYTQLGLEATELGKPLYEKLGFRATHKILSLAKAPSPILEYNPPPLCEERDLAHVQELDERAFGGHRGEYIRKAFYEENSLIFLSKEHGNIDGFVICTDLENNQIRIGPWVQENEKNARAFLSRVLSTLHPLKKDKIVIHVAENHPRAISLLHDLNFQLQETSLHMVMGKEMLTPTYFALWSLDVG